MAIPAVILKKLSERGYSIAGYCKRLNHPSNWLHNLYTGDMGLSRYQRLAKVMGVSVDRLVEIIESRGYIDLFQSGIKNGRFTSRCDLSKKAKVSECFLRSLNKNSGELKAIESAVIMARDLGLRITEICPGTEDTANVA